MTCTHLLFVKFSDRILFITFILFSTGLQAKNYFISSSGFDTNSGLTTGAAWQSIDKVNSFKFAAGDSILFRRGDTFYGGIIAKKDDLNFGAFGTGANPVITGLSTVTGWINLGGNIWEAPLSNANPGINLVLRNSTIQQVGRYPNADAANGGYLTYTAATNTSLTGPALSSTTNWTGAEIVIKENRWTISRQNIVSHSGGVVSFTVNPTLPRVNYGYFFQRDSRTLDKDGEWWHNVASKKLRMYFSSNDPGSNTIQVATIDTLFKCQSFDNLTITDLSFTGSGKGSICINGGSFVTIRNCDINNSGSEAITAKTTYNITIDNCTTTNSLGSGMNVTYASGGTVNILVKNCTVLNTSYIAGMGINGSGGEGIKCIGGNNVKVLNNRVTNSGYIGIKWQGNDVYIKYNLVDKFCTLRDDGAGIYSWEDPTKPETRVNRNIVSNIILNGVGNNQGTNDKSTSVQGLYFDLGSKIVTVDSNTIAYVASNAIHGNNCGSLTFRSNVIFGNERGYSFQRFAGAALIRNITIKKNIVYPYLFRYRNLGIDLPSITKETDIRSMGTIDSNYYSTEPGTDTSLTSVTTFADKTNYKEEYLGFPYLTGTIGVEKNSTKFANTGTLEYNASNSPKLVPFSGLSKKDVYGKIYNNSVTIPAWSSKVLIPNGKTSPSSKTPLADEDTTLKLSVTPPEFSIKGTVVGNRVSTFNKIDALKISGFPNPSTTEFGLLVRGGSNEKIAISVMDAVARIVFQTTGTVSASYKFGNKFMPGVYIIKVTQGNNIQILKLVKI